MLVSDSAEFDSVRFANSDSPDRYVNGFRLQCDLLSRETALEESFFLGLRLNQGVDLRELSVRFGKKAIAQFQGDIAELMEEELLQSRGDVLVLTSLGRLLSNEVFERFIAQTPAPS
jgi:oxygen-independent coproporphyrinogen-3 oxidase